MLQDSSRQLLRAAALETIDRIRTDHEQVPSKLKPLLAYIEDHLFDADLSVNRIKKACGVRDNSVAIHFHVCRPAAARLYLPVPDGGRLAPPAGLGAAGLENQRPARFFEHPGLQPRLLPLGEGAPQHVPPGQPPQRRRNRRVGARRRAGARRGSILPPRVTEDFWRRALTGSLRDEEASELIRHLLELYPPRRR